MGLLLMATAAWLIFLVSVSALSALAFPLLARLLTRLHPASRAIALRALAIAPVGLASIGVLLCFAPKLFGRALSRVDHCVQHADGHPHFCLNHPPQFSLGVEWWISLALVGVAVLVGLAMRGSNYRRSSRLLRQLASTARYDARHRAWLIDSDLPVAMSVGILRTRTLLSSGLLQGIPARLVDAILEHERAHEVRRDGLWKLSAELFSLGHVPAVRRAILEDLELACEQACDEDAGSVLGDRTQVAEALLAMERVRQGLAGLGPAALAFGAHGLTARIESLLSDGPGRRLSRRVVLTSSIAGLALAIAAADPLHHFTETLIHYVLG